jgi:predicted transcriptional regulator
VLRSRSVISAHERTCDDLGWLNTRPSSSPAPEHHFGALWYHNDMAMTLRLDPHLEAQLREAAEEDHRSIQQTVVLAVETYLALRETAEVRADPEALRALAEARQAVQEGDVVYGTDAVRDLLRGRQAS